MSELTSEMFTLFVEGLCDGANRERPAAAAASSSSSAQPQVLMEVRGGPDITSNTRPMLLPSSLTAKMNDELRDRYHCIGVVLGRALLLGKLLPSVFPLAFCKVLLVLLHTGGSIDSDAPDQEAALVLKEPPQ